MEIKFLLLIPVILSFFLIGCGKGIYTEPAETITQKITQQEKQESFLVSKTTYGFKVSIKQIIENETHLHMDIQIENVGDKTTQNVLFPNGPDYLVIRYDSDFSDLSYVDSKGGACDTLPNKRVEGCNPLDFFVILDKPNTYSKFILEYWPIMWMDFSEKTTFYFKKENDNLIPITEEEYNNTIK